MSLDPRQRPSVDEALEQTQTLLSTMAIIIDPNSNEGRPLQYELYNRHQFMLANKYHQQEQLPQDDVQQEDISMNQ